MHNHNHDNDLKNLNNISIIFYISIVLNLLFTITEYVMGYITDSLSLIADATHNFGDVGSLIIALIAHKLLQKASNKFYTYGYKRISITAALVNAIILIVLSINIGISAIERFTGTPQLVGLQIIITSAVGVVINTLSALLFWKSQKSDINIKGAFLHLLIDSLVSVSVLVSGIIIQFTGWNLIDPIMSILISVVILLSTWKLLRESFKLSLDAVPNGINVSEIESMILENQKIKYIHHLHIWALSSRVNASTVHVVLKEEIPFEDFFEIKKDIKNKMRNKNIKHITIEIDKPRY
ncbi:cation diffusion facilitator family transporter [Mycoplasma phocoenae]|uniref:Cation transporter n=1 Tax=Mycoplasma phocoenae TaxID=754517 RepID=A0A858U0Z7_9MOLU|nr:cation diffusion facilitator family transporter [Mycoplasma phocoenae]QJG66764.1 cation transporter [Mycoplasma phocoenae]